MPPTPSTTTATTATPVPPSPSGPALAWVSSDLNVTVRGRILSQQEPGTIEGVVLQLEDQGGVEIKHPSLVSILTKPESQTLFNINTGERLFTLSTPLIPDDAEESPSGDTAAAVEDDDEDPDGDVPSLSALDSAPSSASPSPSRSRSRTRPITTTTPPKAKKPTLITLHSALLPFSSTSELESSPLYSRTFHIIIDGPSFPAPHFDPSTIVPPTPLVRPHGAAGGPGGEGLAGPAGVLNSPTLQRALLSPLLSPQRRASSQASDASVPPLNLGLSRTSRPSFTGGERPSGLRAQHGASPAAAAQAKGLAAFVPPVLPPGSSQQPSAGPSPSSLTPPPVPDLPSTLHTSLSTAAKKTAEEILSLRREHDLFVRRAKAELEVLEGRIEDFKANGIGGLGGEEGVVRGFRTKEDREREKAEKAEKSRSTSQSRDRSRTSVAPSAEPDRSVSRPRGSRERGRPGWGAAETSSTQQILKATDMDESLSLRMRAEDEREEEERGRSRSRMRRGGGADTAAEERRSRSRTKAVAEATRRAVEGAREKSASRDRAGAGGNGGAGGGGEEGAGGGRGTPRKGESIPATLKEEDEEEEEEGGQEEGEKKEMGEGKKDSAPTSATGGASSSASTTSTTGPNGLLSPPPPSTASTSATTAPSPSPSSSSSAPLGPSHPPPATPTFIPSSSKALLSVPEEEEEGEGEGGGGGGDGFSDLPPSREESREGSRERGRRGWGREERQGRKREETGVSEVTVVGEDDLDEDQPFEMDEDVDADASSSRLAAPSPSRSTDRRQSPATLEVERPESNPPPPSASQQQPISGSFKPGSFQRASALSASYAQLLTTHNTQLSRTPSPNPPPAGQSPLSALGSPATASRAADGLPPFSPPDAKSPVTTSAREDAHNALAASILERSVGAGVESVLRGNVRDQVRAGPDPRDVRRGEQKIRDVLAMDVPSHRPRAGAGVGRRASVGGGGTYTPDADVPTSDEDGEEDDDAEEGKDRVDDLNASLSTLRSPPSLTTRSSSHQQQFQVGSLPIALGRPSTVNAALSSWRPDPERLWVQEREKHRASGAGRGGEGGGAASGGRPEGPFSLRTGSGGSGRAPASPASGLGTGGPPTPAGWTGATQAQTKTQPVDIGSPTAAPPGAGTTTTGARSINIGGMQRANVNAGGGLSSSLAQSLRAAPASFSARAEAEQRFSLAAHAQGQGQKDRLPPELEDPAVAGGEGDKEADEEDEEEEGFVPPHVVAERRERRDERYLSRSVSRR